MRGWFGCLLLLLLVACGGERESAPGGGGATGGAGPDSGGSGGATGPCGEATKISNAYATQIAVDGATLYFTGGQDLQAMPVSGGTAKVLVKASSGSGIAAFALDASFVYYTDWGSEDASGSHGFVMKLPKAGGTPTVLASEQSFPGAIALDGTWAYWTTRGLSGSQGAVNRVALDGGTPIVLTTGLADPTSLLTDGEFVYAGTPQWGGSELLKIPVAGGPAVKLATLPTAASALALRSSMLYVACESNHGVDTSSSDGSIYTVPTPMGWPSGPLASNLADPRALVLDEMHVYWTNWGTLGASGVDQKDGSVMRVEQAGGVAYSVVSADAATGIAVDDSCFYWSQTCPTSEDCRGIWQKSKL